MARVIHHVRLIPQCGTLTCWYACVQMIVAYHRRRTRGYSPVGADIGTSGVTAAVCGGNRFINLSVPGAVSTIAREAHLSQILMFAPRERYVAGLLEAHGPLWYSGHVRGYRNVQGGAHAVVIRGIDGDELLINDPAPVGSGWQGRMDFDTFFRQLPWIRGAPIVHA